MHEARIDGAGSRIDRQAMIHWIEDHCEVQNISPHIPGAGIPAMLKNTQLDALSKSKAILLEADTTITLKTRQVGSSTGWMLAIEYITNMRPGVKILWVSPDPETHAGLRLKYDIIAESAQRSKGSGASPFKKRNDTFYQKENGSVIMWGVAGQTEHVSKAVGRGDTFHLAVLTELAYWPEAQAALDSLSPALELNGMSIIIDSTPNGLEGAGSVFHRYCMSALSGAPQTTLLFWPWWWERKYRTQLTPEQSEMVEMTLTPEELSLMGQYGLTLEQIAWRRQKIVNHGDNFFEIYIEDPEGAFVTGKDSIFTAERMSELKSKNYGAWAPPEVVVMFDETEDPPPMDILLRGGGTKTYRDFGAGVFRMYRTPDDAVGQCVIAIDAAGEGADPLVAVVIDSDAEVCAMLRCRVGTLQFADLAQRVAIMFKAALFVEGEGYGREIHSYIVNPQSPDILKRTVGLSSTVLNPYGLLIKDGLSPINKKTRPTIVGLMLEFLEQGLVEVPDRWFFTEMNNLIMHTTKLGNSRVQHAPGCHDDILMAFGHALLGRRFVLSSPGAGRLAGVMQSYRPSGDSGPLPYFGGRRHARDSWAHSRRSSRVGRAEGGGAFARAIRGKASKFK